MVIRSRSYLNTSRRDTASRPATAPHREDHPVLGAAARIAERPPCLHARRAAIFADIVVAEVVAAGVVRIDRLRADAVPTAAVIDRHVDVANRDLVHPRAGEVVVVAIIVQVAGAVHVQSPNPNQRRNRRRRVVEAVVPNPNQSPNRARRRHANARAPNSRQRSACDWC